VKITLLTDQSECWVYEIPKKIHKFDMGDGSITVTVEFIDQNRISNGDIVIQGDKNDVQTFLEEMLSKVKG
jgi:hypothetical protein